MKITPARLAMLLGPWATMGGPLYAALAGALRGAVERGEIPEGTVLPPERELARRLHVSRTTVVGAYGALKEDGVLESRQGRGTWVAAPASAAAEASPAGDVAFSGELYSNLIGGGGDVIELTAAAPLATTVVAEEAARLAADGLAGRVAGVGYVPAGLPELRERIAEMHGAQGLPTRPDEVLVTTGAQQAIGLVTELFGEAGQAVLVEEATYPGALDLARAAAMRPVGAALDEGGVVVDAVEELMDRVRPRFAYLVPVHQNPTGSVLSDARSRAVAELSARYRVPVVEDLALRDMRLSDRPVPAPIAAHDPEALVITIGSMSKVFWAGLRVGWIRAPRPIVERLVQLKVRADLSSDILSQAVAAAALPRLADAAAERRADLGPRHRVLAAALARHLPEWTWDTPTGGCILWVRIPGGDAREFGQVAQRYGVTVVPGQVLSASGGHADRLRLPFVAEEPVLEEAARRLALAWSAYRGGGAAAEAPAAIIV
ncbi:MAG: PLP-dependent aminotransferase family protein [Thermoleophilia bacterium]